MPGASWELWTLKSAHNQPLSSTLSETVFDIQCERAVTTSTKQECFVFGLFQRFFKDCFTLHSEYKIMIRLEVQQNMVGTLWLLADIQPKDTQLPTEKTLRTESLKMR